MWDLNSVLPNLVALLRHLSKILNLSWDEFDTYPYVCMEI